MLQKLHTFVANGSIVKNTCMNTKKSPMKVIQGLWNIFSYYLQNLDSIMYWSTHLKKKLDKRKAKKVFFHIFFVKKLNILQICSLYIP